MKQTTWVPLSEKITLALPEVEKRIEREAEIRFGGKCEVCKRKFKFMDVAERHDAVEYERENGIMLCKRCREELDWVMATDYDSFI